MIDTVSLHIDIEPPAEVKEKIREPFLWNGITFSPSYTSKGFIYSYSGRLNNLYLTFNETGLNLGNSWHKYYHGKNWNDYTFSEIVAVYKALNERFDGLIESAQIKRIDYGVNLTANPGQVFNDWYYLRTKIPFPMHYKGKKYGMEFNLDEYSFKGYDKTEQIKRQNYIKLPTQITRLEKSVFKMRSITRRKRNRIPLYTAKDLTNQNIIRQLADDFINTYQNIEKMEKINFKEMSASQIKIVATMRNKEAREALRQTNYRTYKRYLREYRKIVNGLQSTNKTFGMITEKAEYLVNA
jgi:hypothetical protein